MATSVEAELSALRDGLALCLSLNIPAVEIEIDAKVVVDWINNGNISILTFLPLDCRMLASRIPQVKLTHCYLEANKCANALDRKGPFN